jgi:hypothetical protein
MVMVTASGPAWVMESTIGPRMMPRSSEAFCASKLVVRAAPSHAVPSWNKTLGRTVIVQAV